MQFTPEALVPPAPHVVGHVGQLNQTPAQMPAAGEAILQPPPPGPKRKTPPVRVQASTAAAPAAPAPDPAHAHIPEIDIALKDLPSQGKPYPPGTSVRYRPYTFGEVKKISQGSTEGRRRFDAIMAGVDCRGIDKWKLTLGDALYLGLLRKISSVGTSKAHIPYVCGHCGSRNVLVLDIGGADKVALEFDDIAAPALPIRVELSCGDRVFMPVTVGDFVARLDKLVSPEGVEDGIAMLASYCVNVPFEQAYEEFSNVTGTDGELLNEIDRLLYHSAKDMITNCASEACGKKNSVELDGGQALILPFRTDQEPLGGRIHFGEGTRG